jgi:hypothetical protein
MKTNLCLDVSEVDFLDQPPSMWDCACDNPYANESTICTRPNRPAIKACRLVWITALYLIYYRISHSDHLGKL